MPHTPPHADESGPDPFGLDGFVLRYHRILVLTGAGCSTESGIPDYRDSDGQWKRPQPMNYQLFTGDELARRRYWARSMVGWPVMQQARPNMAHLALAALERVGRLSLLVTQNVDGLHQLAGSRHVVDLHGRLDQVICLRCGMRQPRLAYQSQLEARNPAWIASAHAIAPDGDAETGEHDFEQFFVPPCRHCGGMVKPDVVFYGETVPRARVEQVRLALDRADAMLVVGSSLSVYSGFRFVKEAAAKGLPIAAVNIGRSRADSLYQLHLRMSASEALGFMLEPEFEQIQAAGVTDEGFPVTQALTGHEPPARDQDRGQSDSALPRAEQPTRTLRGRFLN